ncbi:hypothetical protein NIES2135_05100 [Leptolyngbya boryana NIES-2135]|uniref:Uncharacterized protein n=2 Tax=Leptolyngbya group TaxID=3081713 RepID=A0A1Z4JAF4_LEPBY|nr:hypothetical protein [Leptolyngbya boryana]BAY53700.1 hypothetical protein NIES2135_05100 [Leptolyngbya boryana NIES-2135]
MTFRMSRATALILRELAERIMPMDEFLASQRSACPEPQCDPEDGGKNRDVDDASSLDGAELGICRDSNSAELG